MPWLSIIMAIIGFLTSLKKNPGDKGRAVAFGALAGLGTYYVSHETTFGQETIGQWDGVVPPDSIAAGQATVTNPDGSISPASSTHVPSTTTGQTSGVWDAIKSVGPAGIASAVGVTAVATGLVDWKKWLPWIIGGVVVWKALG